MLCEKFFLSPDLTKKFFLKVFQLRTSSRLKQKNLKKIFEKIFFFVIFHPFSKIINIKEKGKNYFTRFLFGIFIFIF